MWLRQPLNLTYDIQHIQSAVGMPRRDSNKQVWPREDRLPETDGAKFWQQSDQVGLHLVGIHQMAPPEHTFAFAECICCTCEFGLYKCHWLVGASNMASMRQVSYHWMTSSLQINS